MKVELAKLKMSHVRDFKIDPLEKEEAKELVDSMQESGFWGGVVLNKGHNGDIEVVAGHKRVWAAMEAGITHADLHLGKYDDREMIRIYCTENITQRGEKAGLAMAGAVASAVRYLVKAILKGDDRLSQICDKPDDLAKLRGNIASEKGLGVPCILKFYKGISGIRESIVTHHVANLKASGDYARIVKEVTEEIEKEHAEELAELERKQREAEEQQKAEEAAKAKAKKEKAAVKHSQTKATGKKASEAAAKEDVFFDLAGVGKHLKNENQIRAFRDIVKQASVRKHLPVENQAALAAALVAKAKKTDVELSGKYVQENLINLIHEVGQEQRKIDAQAQKEMEEYDVRIKWHNLSHHFARNVLGIKKDGKAMLSLMEKHTDIKLGATKEVRKAVIDARDMITELAAEFQRRFQ